MTPVGQNYSPPGDKPRATSNSTSAKPSVSAIVKAAQSLAKNEKWRAAARELTRAARVEPHNVARWIQISDWQRQSGDTQNAIKTLQLALKLNTPGKTRGRPSAAQASTPSRRSTAAHVFSAADRATLQAGLAETFLEAQKWAECIAACKELLEYSPRHHYGRELLATAFLHDNRVDEAADIMRELLQISPRDPLHRLKYATLLQLQGNSGEALREFQRVLATYPDAPFSSEANDAIEILDNMQIQQVLLRAAEQDGFRLQLQHEFENTLQEFGFHLSENGRETLRYMLGDGRPDALPVAPRIH